MYALTEPRRPQSPTSAESRSQVDALGEQARALDLLPAAERKRYFAERRRPRRAGKPR